jgi:heat shock protein HslJ
MSVRSARHVAQGLWLSLALVAGLALAQAPTPDQAGSAHAPGIYAHSEQDWTLVEINGRPLPEGARPPTLRIDGEHIAGFGGCNRYMGPIRDVGPGEVAIGPLAGTMMACPEPGMALEQGFLSVLGRVSRYAFVADRLLLEGADGDQARSLLFAPDSR